jgi:branched-chain amino acid transport system permease protein
MSAETVPAPTASNADDAAIDVDTRLPSILTAATRARVVLFAVTLLIALLGVPFVFASFWTKIMLEMAAYSLVALGLNLIVGRVGIYSLCQIPLVAAGAWFSLRLYYLFDENLPFPLILLGAGLLTGGLGVIIGLPALRLSGLYLALVTLMAAGAITLLLVSVKFPNGGPGFWGFDTRSASGFNSIPRPGIAESDDAYYRYTVIVAAVMFLVAAWHVKGKPGRAWASLRQSELTAISAGINTTLYKLWAFALSAAIAGVAGGVIAAANGVTTNQFPVEQSIILLAVVLLGGAYNLWGAIVAAFFLRVFPQILDKKLGLPTELLTMLFGVGVLFTLMMQPKGVVEDLTNLGRMVGTKLGLVKQPLPDGTTS